MDLIPPSDRVLVRQLEPESETASGLLIPEIAQEKSLRAVVLAVGAGTPHPKPGVPGETIPLGLRHRTLSDIEDGKLVEYEIAVPLEPGDEVVLPRYGGTEIQAEDSGETIISILASEILAVVS